MKVITTREVRNEMKTYFDLAEEEKILVKRGKKFVNLIITDDPDRVFLDDNWVRDFFAVPAEYRCNPFDVSPSGDLFWADKRNVEQLGKAIKAAETGKKHVLKPEDQKKFFGLE